MDDLEHFGMRMREEREATRIATSAHARECHEELASAYELRCRILRDQLQSSQEQRVRKALERQGF
jgi:hypothetical protein